MSNAIIKPVELKALLDQRDTILLDVREPAEFRAESILGALNVPLSSLTSDSLRSFEGKTVVVHCQSGNRSKQASQKIGGAGLNVKDLEGGITGWKKAGLPTETAGATCPMPLMRQVQLTIGIFVLAGTALSYFVSPVFLIIPLIMGAGLTNAGLTGWCGLAKLMAVMPWNRS